MSEDRPMPDAEAVKMVRPMAEDMKRKGARLITIMVRDNGDGTLELTYIYDVGGRVESRRFSTLPDWELDTISDIYAGATNLERENVDLFGMKFKGMAPGLLLEAGKSMSCPLRKQPESEEKKGGRSNV